VLLRVTIARWNNCEVGTIVDGGNNEKGYGGDWVG